MKKGEKYVMVSGAGKGKVAVEENGKRASHRTNIGMDFDLKTFKFRNQDVVARYLARDGFRLNPGIKIEFCPHGIDVSLAPPDREGVYVHSMPICGSSAVF